MSGFYLYTSLHVPVLGGSLAELRSSFAFPVSVGVCLPKLCVKPHFISSPDFVKTQTMLSFVGYCGNPDIMYCIALVITGMRVVL